ncbi:hypothetical protein [Novipirellula aureliae]|nr:hypothetical protein [Novipirellula aureliae]
MHSEAPSWKDLKIGDRIRIVKIPSVFAESHYHNGDWDETFALYRDLILRNMVVTVCEIDGAGRPWIEFDSLDADGNIASNSLAVDDDSWVFAETNQTGRG